jgi:hypothetical protein
VSSINFSLIWLYASIAYIVFSFRWYRDETGKKGFIEADEIAVRKFFGNPTDIISSGLPFLPLGLFEMERLPTIIQQKEFPAEPKDIYRGDGEPPQGKVPPVRVTFRSSVTETEAKKLLGNEYSVSDERNSTFTFISNAPKDGLSKRVTAEIVPVVRWKILDGINFIKNIGSLEEANRQLEDELYGVLGRLLPNMSVGQAKQNFLWINVILKKAAITRTKDWGIEIEGAFLKMIPLHHELNNAIALAAEAEFQGRGEREMLEQRGAGTAKATEDLERQTLIGRATGLRQLADSLGIKGEEAIAQFVAGQLASGQGTIILGESGLTQLAGIGAALMKKGGKNV